MKDNLQLPADNEVQSVLSWDIPVKSMFIHAYIVNIFTCIFKEYEFFYTCINLPVPKTAAYNKIYW